MTGSSFFDYVHHQDHVEVAEQLGLGLAQGQNLSSPNSAGSEEGVNSSTGTNNPDGKLYFSRPRKRNMRLICWSMARQVNFCCLAQIHVISIYPNWHFS
jgi:hypothetical protein